MMLTREECLFALESLKPCNIYEFNAKGYLSFIEANSILKQLINEHFELVDLLKKHYLENLTIEELDKWFDRSLWHVNKVNELSNKTIELSRDVKSKQEIIDVLTTNPPLKFEELKENMWVWDNKTKSYIFIFKPLNWEPIKGIRYANMIINHSAEGYYMDFEEDRFYRYEVKL